MTQIASTHTGTCQLCGKQHMLPGGTLAAHGYTVTHGFFNGVCGGAHHAPFEKSKELAEASIVRAEERRDHFLARAAAVPSTRYEDGTIWFDIERKSNDRWGSKYRTWERAAFDAETNTVTAKDGTVNKVYRYEKEESWIANQQEGYRKHLRRIAEEGRLYIEWQTKRCAEWTEQELKPVADKDAGKTHVLRYADGSGYVRATYGKGWGGVHADKTADAAKAARYTEKGAKMTLGKLRAWKTIEVVAL